MISMKQIHRQKQQYINLRLSLCSLMLFMLSACIHQPSPESMQQADPGTAPTLSGLSASPNPAKSGSVIQFQTNYVDPDSDLHSGIAAISINGGELSSIAFRSTYPSGVLTLPFNISPYSRPSDLHISLKIRDDAGNWSNAVSMTLLVREPTSQAPFLQKEDEGL